MDKKKKVKSMAELTKGFEEMNKEYSTDGKNAFRKVVKKAVNVEKPN